MATRHVKAAAMASVTLALTGVVLQRAVVLPREARARAELAELDAEAQRAAFKTPDPGNPFLRRITDDLDGQLLELNLVLPETRDAARDGFLAGLRRIGAWSAELESLDWSDRSSGGARYFAGQARVRIEPSGRGWLATVRNLRYMGPIVTIGCVDVSDLSDPSSPVTLEVTLYAQPSGQWLMMAGRPTAEEPGARGFRWADVFRRPPETPVQSQEIPDSSASPVLASLTRGECWIRCQVYSIVVHEDGIVDYEGKEWVKIEGTHHYRIAMDRVRALSVTFDAAGFSSFDASYDTGRTDVPLVQVSHRGKTVSHQLFGVSAPPSLTQLEDDFDRIVGADQWIGTSTER
jgi:hypothetical protein